MGVHIEHRPDAFGIGKDHPRLSWIVVTEGHGWRQAGYEIESYDPNGKLRDQTGRAESGQSVLVEWHFKPLASRERVTVRVRVWSVDGQASAWSEPVLIEVGLLHPQDWTARFVGPD